MVKLDRTHLADLRGASRAAIDATAGMVEIVERMHRTIGKRPWPLGQGPPDAPSRGVYRIVRGVVKLVGRGIDLSLAPIASLLPKGERSAGREAFVAALNGVFGDHLAATSNPLATPMSLRIQGRRVDATRPMPAFERAGAPRVTGKLLVLVHGLCMNDLEWLHDGHDHGAALARDLGYTPLYLRYNTGLHVAHNGRELDALLETLVAHWPVPVRELAIVGHSMGGLVARSACHQASGRAWTGKLAKLAFLGTPHLGAPLERGGGWLDYLLELSPYSAPLARIGSRRSAGIRDLRLGAITRGRHRHVALPEGVRCFAAAATLGKRRGAVTDRIVGDGLVPVDSALGRHPDAALRLAFRPRDQWIGLEMGHLSLLGRPEAYARLRDWLE